MKTILELIYRISFYQHLMNSCYYFSISGTIDIDRLVQEKDLVSLQENLISIINYNLDSEYDVKILDPNFVKLFKLAQLSVDYLMYSEQHAYNCMELEHQHLKKHLKVLQISVLILSVNVLIKSICPSYIQVVTSITIFFSTFPQSLYISSL